MFTFFLERWEKKRKIIIITARAACGVFAAAEKKPVTRGCLSRGTERDGDADADDRVGIV